MGPSTCGRCRSTTTRCAHDLKANLKGARVHGLGSPRPYSQDDMPISLLVTLPTICLNFITWGWPIPLIHMCTAASGVVNTGCVPNAGGVMHKLVNPRHRPDAYVCQP
eukprot:1140927-Pelagomonas_calceolata.AAC.10